MYDTSVRSSVWRFGSRAVVLAIGLVIAWAPSREVRAQDEIEMVYIEAGKLRYEKYCMPCHGPGGAPGSAVNSETKEPVDLRTYVERNGGKFPAGNWLAVVAGGNPGSIHTKIWEQIRDAQTGSSAPTAEGRAAVASIANYVRSIQKK